MPSAAWISSSSLSMFSASSRTGTTTESSGEVSAMTSGRLLSRVPAGAYRSGEPSGGRTAGRSRGPVALPPGMRKSARRRTLDWRLVMTIQLPPSKLFIAGDWRPAADGRTIPVFNPSDGESFTTIARGVAVDIDTAVTAARAAAVGAWGRMTAVERGRLLLKLARAVQDDHDTIARLES
ncbi:MAG: aldehyde dehydrogenase family protein, partial [Alphaproteobacteria bacterium]|nr:aldehyde dehydrogenase family protein [Alphaproteobacteria bacterium]